MISIDDVSMCYRQVNAMMHFKIRLNGAYKTKYRTSIKSDQYCLNNEFTTSYY